LGEAIVDYLVAVVVFVVAHLSSGDDLTNACAPITCRTLRGARLAEPHPRGPERAGVALLGEVLVLEPIAVVVLVITGLCRRSDLAVA